MRSRSGPVLTRAQSALFVGAAALAIDAALSASRRPGCTPSSAWAACSRRRRGAGARRDAGRRASPRAPPGSSPWSRPRRSARVADAARACGACPAAPRCSARRARSRRCSRCAGCARPSRACAQRSRRATSATRAPRAARDLVSRDTSQLDASELVRSGHPVAGREPQRLGRRAAAGLRRRRAARGRGLPRAQHRRRDVGLPHARAAAPRPGRGPRRRCRQPRPRAAHGAADRRARAAAPRGAARRAARPRARALAQRRLADGGDGGRARRAPRQARLLRLQRRGAARRPRPTSAARWRWSVG